MSRPRPRLTRTTIAVAGQLPMFPDTPYRRHGSRNPQTAAPPEAARRTPPSPRGASATPTSALPRQRGLPPDALTAAASTVPLIVERTQTGTLRVSSPALPGRYVGVRPGDRAGLGLAALQFLTEADIAGYSARRSGAYTSRGRIPTATSATPGPTPAAAKWRTRHNPHDWTPPTPDEPRWTAPGGAKYREGTQQVVRARALRIAAGIHDDPPPQEP